jgi:hypothetical protein
MTTKRAIALTFGIIAAAIGLGLLVLFWYVDPSARGAGKRATWLGQGLAIVCLIPLGGVWIMWADRFRKERERNRLSDSEMR